MAGQTHFLGSDVSGIVDALAVRRVALGMTQQQVGDLMHTASSGVSRTENHVGNPTLSTLQRYAHAVDAELYIVVVTKPVDDDMENPSGCE